MVKSIRHKHELSQLSSNTEDQTSAQNAALVSLSSKQSLPRSRSVSHDPGQMHLGTSVYLAEGRPPFCEQPLFVQKRLLRSRRHSSSYTGTPRSIGSPSYSPAPRRSRDTLEDTPGTNSCCCSRAHTYFFFWTFWTSMDHQPIFPHPAKPCETGLSLSRRA